jgi:hypothetical protein
MPQGWSESGLVDDHRGSRFRQHAAVGFMKLARNPRCRDRWVRSAHGAASCANGTFNQLFVSDAPPPYSPGACAWQSIVSPILNRPMPRAVQVMPSGRNHLVELRKRLFRDPLSDLGSKQNAHALILNAPPGLNSRGVRMVYSTNSEAGVPLCSSTFSGSMSAGPV